MPAWVRFLVFNLLLSLAAGLFAWLLVLAAVRWLKIRSSALSFCFFSLPFFKSLLILVGIGLVLPWPAGWLVHWHSLALSFRQVIPVLLVWAGGVLLAYAFIVRGARKTLLQDARPAAESAPRLAAAFSSIQEAYRQVNCPLCSDDLCCVRAEKLEPRLLVSGRISSPLALTDGGDPLILFPAGLVAQLTDAELQGALAHELAHFVLRRPDWCSAGTLQKLTLVNPVTGLVGEFLQRQEEKACDDLAVSIVGQPEQYAGMLTKSFRFAREQAKWGHVSRLYVLPRLLGFKPLLSERVEHLLSPDSPPEGWKQSRAILWLVLAALIAVLFFSWGN